MSLPFPVALRKPSRHTAFCLLSAALVLAVIGCGSVNSQLPGAAGQSSTSSTGSQQSSGPVGIPQTIIGQVHGGLESVSGAHIYLFAAAATGYAGPSISLLNPSFPGVYTDSVGAYVISDGSGYFNLNGAYTCTSGQQVYVLALGGNPGLPNGGTNPAIALISVLGACPGAGSFAGIIPGININEVSTVAAVYSLAGFMTDPTHIGAPANPLAQQGLANAFLANKNLVDVPSGYAPPNSVAGNGMIPQATINSLANLLATCVNTDGTGSECANLFANAKDANSVLPADTATAALNIAHNPGASVAALFNQSLLTLPFAPYLTNAPNDWTVAITFYSDSMSGPYYPAIDALGNVWVPGYANNTLTEFDPQGIPLSGGGSSYSGNSLNQPYSVAIDSGQSAWVTNFAYNSAASVSRFTTGGAASGTFPCGTNCTSIAFDSLQNVWIGASSGTTTMHNSGVALSQFNTSSFASGLAIDSVGRGWAMGTSHNLYRLTLPSTVAQFNQSVTGASNDLSMFAIDSSDNVWFTSGKNNAIGRADSNGNITSPSDGFTGGGLQYPAQLAIDGSNRVWVANRDGNSVSAFTGTGTAITSATGFQPSGQVPPDPKMSALTGLRSPHGLAIDGSGNVWVTNFTANSITEILGLATPVVTPISPTTHGSRP